MGLMRSAHKAFEFLFQENPRIFKAAINHLVFNMELSSNKLLFKSSISPPKKRVPHTPGNYRPFNMLEVLYKIPSRVLAKQLTLILPTIKGDHQPNFKAGTSIQESSLLATHLTQDVELTQYLLQLVSLDIEKSFDHIGLTAIIQAVCTF
jgi:hypothetical protein